MINTKKYIVLTMVAVLVFFTGCKDKNTQVSLTDKAENNRLHVWKPGRTVKNHQKVWKRFMFMSVVRLTIRECIV